MLTIVSSFFVKLKCKFYSVCHLIKLDRKESKKSQCSAREALPKTNLLELKESHCCNILPPIDNDRH